MAKKTRDEVERLKMNWLSDPCFQLDTAEGFESYADELARFREYHENRWEKENQERLSRIADSLGIPGNLLLAKYLMILQDRINELESKVIGE